MAQQVRQVVAAQGEVMIFRIEQIPAGLDEFNDVNERGQIIIGHSESGHHHVLLEKCPPGSVHVYNEKGMQILYALLEEPNALVQDAPTPHARIDLPPGRYEFRIAREYDPLIEKIRKVAD